MMPQQKRETGGFSGRILKGKGRQEELVEKNKDREGEWSLMVLPATGADRDGRHGGQEECIHHRCHQQARHH